MSDELKPCPFCGGEPILEMIGNDATRSRGTKIKCTTCQVSRTVKAIRFSHEWTRSRSIEAWNRRPQPNKETT